MKKPTRLLSLLLVLILCLSILPAGAMAAETDGWQKQSDGTWFYFKDGEPVTGWVKSGGSWYYLTPAMVYDGLYEIDGDRYYFTFSGKMLTGWKMITDFYIDDNGREVPFAYWAYFRSSGKQVIDGWLKIDGIWYYFDENGMMLRNDLYQIGSYYYHFNSTGAMDTGWVKIPFEHEDTSVTDEWAYFLPSGAMKLDGWQKVGSTWYYFEDGLYYRNGLHRIGNDFYFFNTGGAMRTGWIKFNMDGHTGWHYFQSSGAMKLHGWQKVGSTWYYFVNGSYYSDIVIWINGVQYKFDASGALVE